MNHFNNNSFASFILVATYVEPPNLLNFQYYHDLDDLIIVKFYVFILINRRLFLPLHPKLVMPLFLSNW